MEQRTNMDRISYCVRNYYKCWAIICGFIFIIIGRPVYVFSSTESIADNNYQEVYQNCLQEIVDFVEADAAEGDYYEYHNVCYTLYDLTGDGILEMFVDAQLDKHGHHLYIYSCTDNNAFLFAEIEGLEYGENSKLQFYDGCLIDEYSYKGMTSISLYRFSDDGSYSIEEVYSNNVDDWRENDWGISAAEYFGGEYIQESMPFISHDDLSYLVESEMIKPNIEDDTISFNLSGLKDTDQGINIRVAWSNGIFCKNSSAVLGSEKPEIKLSLLSAAAALTTYSKGKTKDFLEKCGFSNIKKRFSVANMKESTIDDNDHATVYLGEKKIVDNNGDTFTLVAVIISGYSNGYEWKSNFNLGTGTYHRGFNDAADEIVKRLDQYIGDRENVKLWMTGHSRGGALTNIVAQKMCSAGIDQEKIFAVGFATPNYYHVTSGDQKAGKNQSLVPSYTFIANFISPHDFVPAVAPEKWDCYRYNCNNITFDEKLFEKMSDHYRVLTGSQYGGYTKNERDQLVKALAKFGGSVEEYATKKYAYLNYRYYFEDRYLEFVEFTPQDYCQSGLALAASGTEQATAGVCDMIRFSTSGKECSEVTKHLVVEQNGVLTNKIFDSHNMLAYYAWLNAYYDSTGYFSDKYFF